jgi:hypothetical protein
VLGTLPLHNGCRHFSFCMSQPQASPCLTLRGWMRLDRQQTRCRRASGMHGWRQGNDNQQDCGIAAAVVLVQRQQCRDCSSPVGECMAAVLLH